MLSSTETSSSNSTALTAFVMIFVLALAGAMGYVEQRSRQMNNREVPSAGLVVKFPSEVEDSTILSIVDDGVTDYKEEEQKNQDFCLLETPISSCVASATTLESMSSDNSTVLCYPATTCDNT